VKTKHGFVAIAVALSVASGGTLGCEDEGPLEKAGEKVDETVDDITHPGEGPAEEAARKLGEKVDDAKEDLSE
jgi:hypothetical protein